MKNDGNRTKIIMLGLLFGLVLAGVILWAREGITAFIIKTDKLPEWLSGIGAILTVIIAFYLSKSDVWRKEKGYAKLYEMEFQRIADAAKKLRLTLRQRVDMNGTVRYDSNLKADFDTLRAKHLPDILSQAASVDPEAYTQAVRILDKVRDFLAYIGAEDPNNIRDVAAAFTVVDLQLSEIERLITQEFIPALR
ncbi:hypothetical protein ACFSM5_10985 [Lacibacterium aquatile]|uniref:5-bromo-4-chloroindolyl phosphate hydrolysis protein n=1 Tax=Lacibacterium aquatile TaxID=1168082 RepID=A0ABW5DUD0_9PROT